jgi:hypothetical protein
MSETDQATTGKSNKAWLIGSGAVAAAAILVLFVLPAEFGIDPTGLGKAMGLTEIAEPGMSQEQIRGAKRTGVLVLSDADFAAEPGQASDTWQYEFAPFTSIEFKYTMEQGTSMRFDWQASGELHYDMHSHPFEGGPELTESYAVGDATRVAGTYNAAFTGIHGWYWQNRSSDNVTLTLRASGGITESTLFGEFGESKRPIEPIE